MSEETKEQQVSAETQEASAQGAETQSTDHRSEPREPATAGGPPASRGGGGRAPAQTFDDSDDDIPF